MKQEDTMNPVVNPVVALKDVHKRFGSNQVLKGVSFAIPKGQVVAIIGKSGSGKSTALRCIDSLKTMLTPFLPFSCQKLHELLGYDTVIAGDKTTRPIEGRFVSGEAGFGGYEIHAGVTTVDPGAPPDIDALVERARLEASLELMTGRSAVELLAAGLARR